MAFYHLIIEPFRDSAIPPLYASYLQLTPAIACRLSLFHRSVLIIILVLKGLVQMQWLGCWYQVACLFCFLTGQVIYLYSGFISKLSKLFGFEAQPRLRPHKHSARTPTWQKLYEGMFFDKYQNESVPYSKNLQTFAGPLTLLNEMGSSNPEFWFSIFFLRIINRVCYPC